MSDFSSQLGLVWAGTLFSWFSALLALAAAVLVFKRGTGDQYAVVRTFIPLHYNMGACSHPTGQSCMFESLRIIFPGVGQGRAPHAAVRLQVTGPGGVNIPRSLFHLSLFSSTPLPSKGERKRNESALHSGCGAVLMFVSIAVEDGLTVRSTSTNPIVPATRIATWTQIY